MRKQPILTWSYFRLPAFKRAKDGIGYVPCEICIKEKQLGDCLHW